MLLCGWQYTDKQVVTFPFLVCITSLTCFDHLGTCDCWGYSLMSIKRLYIALVHNIMLWLVLQNPPCFLFYCKQFCLLFSNRPLCLIDSSQQAFGAQHVMAWTKSVILLFQNWILEILCILTTWVHIQSLPHLHSMDFKDRSHSTMSLKRMCKFLSLSLSHARISFLIIIIFAGRSLWSYTTCHLLNLFLKLRMKIRFWIVVPVCPPASVLVLFQVTTSAWEWVALAHH